MISPRDQAARKVSEEWHERRQIARETAFSAEQFSDLDRERFDLDDAGVTGEDNERTYQTIEPRTGRVSDMREDPMFETSGKGHGGRR